MLARYAPERYRSEALLLVIPQQVPNDYVTPTMTQPIEERLPAITDQILSRSRLEQIIQQLDLYKDERSRRSWKTSSQRMRADVTTSAVGKDVNSFRVSYVSDNAEKARKVTERLASLYIEQNLKDRENQADSTSQFLSTQLEEAKRRLIEQEKKLEEYRKSHAGQLPSQLQGNLQAIQTASLQLQSLNESTNRAQERRLLIERQIADTQAVPLPAPAVPPAEARAPMGTAQQLELARARLALVAAALHPGHPEVVSLRADDRRPGHQVGGRNAARRRGAGAEKTRDPRRGRAAEADSRPPGRTGGHRLSVGREPRRSGAAQQTIAGVSSRRSTSCRPGNRSWSS